MLKGKDLARFIDLFAKFTRIPKRDLKEFLKDDTDIANLLKRPQAFPLDSEQLKKITELNELRLLMKIGVDVDKVPITSPKAVYNHLINFAEKTDKEHFIALFLDTKNQIIKTEEINIGTHNASLISVKDIAKKAIMLDSASVIVSHNHPSGIPTPSADDIMVTKKIHSALSLVDVTLLDHIVLGDGSFVSLKEYGHMSDMKSISQILAEGTVKYNTIAMSLKDRIVSLYENELPAIKHIKDDTAKAIDDMNEGRDMPMTIKEIKQEHDAVGKRLEVGNNELDLQRFRETQRILDDLRQAQLVEKQIQAQGQLKEETQIIKVNIIER